MSDTEKEIEVNIDALEAEIPKAEELEAAEPEAEVPEADATPEPESVVELDPLAKVQAELDEYKDQLLRHRAEFDNFRRRKAREMDQLRTTAAEGVIADLLPVIDNLERALEHVEDVNQGLAQGVDMVLNEFKKILESKGLESIPGLGQPFDPNVHEALAQQPSDDHPSDTVMLEYERGYKLGDRVVRPAKVVVSSGPAQPEEPATQTDTAEEAASD